MITADFIARYDNEAVCLANVVIARRTDAASIKQIGKDHRIAECLFETVLGYV